METLTLQIFWVFFKMGFLSFGGVFGALPELERMVVQEHGWLTSQRFVQAYVIGQFVPGPNMAMCPLIGYWVHGWAGFLAAFAGIYSGPVLVMAAAYRIYHRGRENEKVRRAERALRPVVLGLLAAASTRLWWVQLGEAGRVEQAASLVLVGAAGWAYAKDRLGPILALFSAGLAWYAVGFAKGFL